MASASGKRIRAEACGWARKLSHWCWAVLGGGASGAAAKNVRPMSAALPTSHAIQQMPFCCIGKFETPFLSGGWGATLRFGTSAGQGQFSPAVAAEFGGHSSDSQRRAEALAKKAGKVSYAEPAEVSTSESQVKFCSECQHSKLLVDFEKTVTSMDGRMDVCRACLAVMRAKILQKELHHLSLSVTEAWERAKACKKCGLTKELRDFPRGSDRTGQTHIYCRACLSACHGARPHVAPTDQDLRCTVCGEVRAAKYFYPSPTSLSGRLTECKDCSNKRSKLSKQTRRKAQIYLQRETKICSACGKHKQAREFYPSTALVDGLQNTCSSCSHIYYNKRYRLRKQRGTPNQASTEQ